MDKKSLYTSCAKYYDLLESKTHAQKTTAFVSNVLKRFNVKSVLEIGCGTGMFVIRLKNKGFDIEGLDLSKEMLGIAKKKNKSIKWYLKNMSDFRINRKYDAIICLGSSLLALPNFNLIEKSIKNSYAHLNSGAILLLDLPNHFKEIKEKSNTKEYESRKMPGGRLDSIYLSYRKGNKWREEWYGTATEGKKVYKFKDVWEEFIYSPKALESSLKKTGFKLLKIYGSAHGTRFDINESNRRVYLCQKNKNNKK